MPGELKLVEAGGPATAIALRNVQFVPADWTLWGTAVPLKFHVTNSPTFTVTSAGDQRLS